MKRINLKGKRVRLFFDQDMDGVIAASLFKLFSGVTIVEVVPWKAGWEKPPKKDPSALDVFIDCRAKNRDEDVRIDHHASDETADYLARDNIIVDTDYHSAVTLVADVLGVRKMIDQKILNEMDLVDSGQKNIFTKFAFGDDGYHKVLFNPGFAPEHYKDFEIFKDILLGFMVKGFAIEDIQDKSAYEQELHKDYGVVVEDIKRPGKPLVKFVHSPPENAYTIKDAVFFSKVLPYVQQHYYEESKRSGIAIYFVGGFLARKMGFDEEARRVVKGEHPEPYQLFASRSQQHATLSMGAIIQAAKAQTGIQNGGGRDSVGGLNTSDENKARAAIAFIVDYIRKNAP